MSDILAGKVWKSDLPGDLKPLAAALANSGHDDGTSLFPSIAYLAWKLSRSERTVQNWMRELKDMEVLVVLCNGSGGRGKIPHYRLCEEKLPKRPEWKSAVVNLKGEIDNQKGAIRDTKGEKHDTKGCNPRQERVQTSAPDYLGDYPGEDKEEDHSLPPPNKPSKKKSKPPYEYSNFQGRYFALTETTPGEEPWNTEAYVRLCEDWGEDAVLDRLKDWVDTHGGKRVLKGKIYAPGDFLKQVVVMLSNTPLDKEVSYPQGTKDSFDWVAYNKLKGQKQ